MKEPILDDDQVDAIYERVHAEWEARNKCAPNLWVAFAAALESTLLEKLCGKPIYQARQLSDEAGRWNDVYEAIHSACTSQPQFYETRIVYALNRSKA